MEQARKAALERALSYPWPQPPALAEPREVAPGVLWLRLPLPFALDHINVWLLRDGNEDGDGYCLVDTGIHSQTTIDLWERILPSLHAPLRRLLVTHFHPDHMGLAHWFCERFGLMLHASSTEFLMALCVSARLDGGTPALIAHFERHGLRQALGEEGEARIRARGEFYPRMVPNVPRQLVRLVDGQTLHIGEHTWRVITGRGHSPEHVALYRASDHVLISGDMVLPRISTNISVWSTEPEADPLTQFETSLEAFAPLPADTLVLPSHGLVFRGLHERLAQLRAHHAERLERTLTLLDAPRCAGELVRQLFTRPMDDLQFSLALGETLAFLHALRTQQRVTRQLGADGVYRFAPTTA